MLAKKRENKGKKLLLPLLIGLIMILSIVGFSLTYNAGDDASSLQNSYEYNGRQYILTSDGWTTKLDAGYIAFTYGPKELESINIPAFQPSSKTYIAYNPEEKDQNIDFIIQKLNNLLLYRNIRPVTACFKESNNCPNIPVVDCSSNDKVIAISKRDKLEVSKEENCLHIRGTTSDLNKITDKLIMLWLGLI